MPNVTAPDLDQSGAAKYLNKAPATLANWRSRSRKYGPPYVKIGSAVRYRQSDLDRWLEQQTINP